MRDFLGGKKLKYTIEKFFLEVISKRFTRFYWSSFIGRKWHKMQDENQFKLFATRISENIKNDNFDMVIEIGCGAGDLISNLKKIKNVKRFIGIDINKKQINANVKKYENVKNVDFVYADIEDYLIAEKIGGNIYFVTQNTLDYFKKERVKYLFELIHEKFKQVTIAVSTQKRLAGIEDSFIRKEHSHTVYHHNYLLLLQEAGYQTKSVDFDKDLETIVIFADKVSD